MEYIKDRNVGNSPNTYWKPHNALSREWCVKLEDGTFFRDKKNRVRRFLTKENAQKAIKKSFHIK